MAVLCGRTTAPFGFANDDHDGHDTSMSMSHAADHGPVAPLAHEGYALRCGESEASMAMGSVAPTTSVATSGGHEVHAIMRFYAPAPAEHADALIEVYI